MPVELVFIHGWGFDTRFWDALAAQIPQFRQSRLNLGFFDEAPLTPVSDPQSKILVGHSLGFIYGMKQGGWKRWIAINAFPRFVTTATQTGCIPTANLREMRARLQREPAKTLQGFYKMIGAMPVAGTPNTGRLRDGLDELRDGDITGILSTLDVPGLVLVGAEDPLVPKVVSRELGSFARNFMLHEKGGHLLPQTDPSWCAGAIADFAAAHFG
jgi:pimeloyl-[acyl-carrier protein] methyl ester esterase